MVAPGTRHTGNQGNALHQTDDDCVLQVERGLRAIPLADPLGDPHHRAPAHERYHHHDPQDAQMPEIGPWARKPTIPIGIEPRITYQANR